MKLNKSTLMQESRAFNDVKLDVPKCQTILCKIIYLLNQGETFTENEAVEIFFNVTKLFNCPDTKLRRLVYVFIKVMKID
jgi:coatomer subunit gamma